MYVQVAEVREFQQLLTNNTSQPEKVAALASVLQVTAGYRLLTMLTFNREKGESVRYYSSRPDVYPAGGSKPIREDSPFFVKVIGRGEVSLSVDKQACAAAFPDHEVLEALDCGSVINVPVRWNGTTLASLNLVHREAWYRDSDIPALQVLAAMAVPIFQHASANNDRG